jgi:hypothetical protein
MDRLERRCPSTASSRPPLPPERLQTIHPGARGGSFHSFPMVKERTVEPPNGMTQNL